MNTVSELQTYLSTTKYDITIILLATPTTRQDPYITKQICAKYLSLKQDPPHGTIYNLTYEYITVTSTEILQFYSTNVTTTLPYLVTYKKRYIGREPWWYPCKQSETTVDLDIFILYSLKN